MFRVLLILLVAGAALAQQPQSVIVPVVGRTIGPGVIWKTDVEIINDTGSSAEISLELATAADAVFLFDLGPGERTNFPDIAQLFGLDVVLSPLIVTTNARRPLTVRATVYGLRGTEMSKPQTITVYTGQGYFPLRALDGLSFSDDFRTNIGLVNFSEREADFLLALQRVPGRNLATTHIKIGPRSLRQTSIQSLFPLISKGHDFTVVVETAAPETYVYASVIDNEHGGRFVQPRVGTR